MISLEVIAAPVIGGLIGLVTNGIAIKMLFRPFNPIKIGKHTLPFTPGLIPKEKSRIARAIGKAVGDNLLDPETLKKALVSENLRQELNGKIDQVIESLGREHRALGECLDEKGLLEPADKAEEYVEKTLSRYVTQRLIQYHVGEEILDYALEEVLGNLNSMIVMVAEPAIRKSRDSIAEKMNEMIEERCPDILESYIHGEYDSWMEKPVKEAGVFLWEKKDMLKDKIWEWYLMILEKEAGKFLEQLDVSAIVEEKINEFEMQELENMILDISRKELNSLVWIGGFLGMLIGFVNLLF